MRKILSLFVLMLLLPLHEARPQEAVTVQAAPALVAPPATPVVSSYPTAIDRFVLAPPTEDGRNRGRGALYGGAIGGVVGGVTFAALNYGLSESSVRGEYTLPSFILGAAIGVTAGAIVGAIVGAP